MVNMWVMMVNDDLIDFWSHSQNRCSKKSRCSRQIPLSSHSLPCCAPRPWPFTAVPPACPVPVGSAASPSRRHVELQADRRQRPDPGCETRPRLGEGLGRCWDLFGIKLLGIWWRIEENWRKLKIGWSLWEWFDAGPCFVYSTCLLKACGFCFLS